MSSLGAQEDEVSEKINRANASEKVKARKTGMSNAVYHCLDVDPYQQPLVSSNPPSEP
jgi:hypothetical protein